MTDHEVLQFLAGVDGRAKSLMYSVLIGEDTDYSQYTTEELREALNAFIYLCDNQDTLNTISEITEAS